MVSATQRPGHPPSFLYKIRHTMTATTAETTREAAAAYHTIALENQASGIARLTANAANVTGEIKT
jgi:hypothetical protein